MIQQGNCGAQMTVCMRQQLVALFLFWLAVVGISVSLVIIPGSETSLQFQNTECTTVGAIRSGANACTFCLKIHVVTDNAPSAQSQLQQDEVTEDPWCTFRSSCEMDKEKATGMLDGLMKIYGTNGSRFSCFSHKSRPSRLTVLNIRRYPKSLLIQLILCLNLSFFILIGCTTHACRRRQRGCVGKRAMPKSGYKTSTRTLTFHWKWNETNVENETRDDVS